MNLPARFTLQIPPGFKSLPWLQAFVNKCIQQSIDVRWNSEDKTRMDFDAETPWVDTADNEEWLGVTVGQSRREVIEDGRAVLCYIPYRRSASWKGVVK